MQTRKIFILILMITSSIMLKAQSPTGFPLPNSPTSYYNIGWIRTDSGSIPAQRDTNFTPRFIGTEIIWPHPGVDTSKWIWILKWMKEGVANISGASPIVYNSSTGVISCPTCAVGGGITQLTGDGTAGPGSGSQVFTLATVNANIGSFGTASNVSSFTVNAKGLITAASQTPIQIAESQVTNLTSDLAAKQPLITTGSTAQYFRGDLSLAVFPTNLSAFTNGPGYITLTSLSALSPALYNNSTGVISVDTSAGGQKLATQGFVTRSLGTSINGSGNLAPLFTTSIVSNTLVFTASTASANTAFGNFTGSTAAASFGKVPLAAWATSTPNTITGFDGSGNPINYTAGTNVTISGGQISASGGGGTQTLQQTYNVGTNLTQVNSINNGGFRQNTTNGLNIYDSLAIAWAGIAVDSVTDFDNSIGSGTGASTIPFRYLSVLAGKYRRPIADYTVSGTSMQVDGLAKIPLIPIFGTNHFVLIIGYVENDINNISNFGTWDTAHCGPIYRQFVDTALARGWPANRIILRGPVWTSPTNFPNATLVRQAQYQAMVQSVASTRGLIFVDCFNPFVYRGTTILYQDQVLHPNNTGHSLIAELIYRAKGDSSRSNGTVGFLNNRITDINQFTYQGNDTLGPKALPLGVDTNGRVGRFTADQIIQNSTILPQAQGASINLTGTAQFGNGASAAMPGGITVNVVGAVQGVALRATGSSPGGLTGNGVEVAMSGSTGIVMAYNRTGSAGLNLSISPLGGVTMFGTLTPTTGPEIVQVNGGVSANYGRFQSSNPGTGEVGQAVEIFMNSTTGTIFSYNRTSSTGLNLNFGAGLSPFVIMGSNTVTGTAPFQVNSAAFISGNVGIGSNGTPTSLLLLSKNISSPSTGKVGVYISSDTNTVTYNAHLSVTYMNWLGRKIIAQTSAHTDTLDYNTAIQDEDSAGTNSTILAKYAFGVLRGKSQFNGSVQIKDGTQSNGFVFTSDANGVGSWQASSGGATNLGYNQNATNNVITSSTGSSATVLTATTNLAGLLDTARARYIDSARNRLLTFNIGAVSGVQPYGSTNDSIALGGTLLQNTTISGSNNFTLTLDSISQFTVNTVSGLVFKGGKYNSSAGSEILGSASTINNPVTAASGTVSNFSAYAFQAPTITSTNASITYTNPATVYIDNAPTMSTNSTASGHLYSLNVNAGQSHFGVGASNISSYFDGTIVVNGGVSTGAAGISLGASTTSASNILIAVGVDPTGGIPTTSGNLWYNGTNLYFVDGSGSGTKRDLLAGIKNYQHSISTPTTGGTVNLVVNQYNIINPSGALLALTVNLPSSPNNNDVVYIKYTQSITTVTYGNGTVVDGITAPVAGGMVVLTYDAGTTSWY